MQWLSCTGTDNIRVIRLSVKNFAHHIGKKLKRFTVVFWIKTSLLPAFAKCCTILKIWVVLVHIAGVRIGPNIIDVIHHLKVTVLFNNPNALFPYKRAKYCRCIFIVIIWCINITDIMEKS